EIDLVGTSYESGQLTSASCGDYCYSHQFVAIPSGQYELRVYAQDTAGGATTETMLIEVVGSTGLVPRSLPKKPPRSEDSS
ncbi:hypothetical protein GTO10_00575, partial [Candidatus Saccharibacteria bacterium]|nr:hypothetical protein [Candidatus Saccharibacteria bacterium]